MVYETVPFKWKQKTWRGCESARVYRTIKQRWTDVPNLLHYAYSSNLLACCVTRSLVSLLRLHGWTTWPKILSPRAAQPTLAQHGIVSRTQPTASRHKLCSEHSPLSFDVKCVQKRPHCPTTQTVQNTAFCLATQIVLRAKPTFLRRKLCPEHSPLTLKATYFLSA
jgi:hypothetical protein